MHEKQGEERQKIVGTINAFKEKGKLVFDFAGESLESNCEVNDNTLIINNHSYLKTLELNEDEVALEGPRDYSDKGKVKIYYYFQAMRRIRFFFQKKTTPYEVVSPANSINSVLL